MGSSANTHALIAARLGYNGEHHEPTSAWQSLGNGHRTYNPVLMRFHSADHESPFARGGINAYTYCSDDPINEIDPSGKGAIKLMAIATMFTGFGVTLGGIGLYAASPNEVQRATALAVVMTGLTVSGIAGYYAVHKYRAYQRNQKLSSEPKTPPATPTSQTTSVFDSPPPSPTAAKRVTVTDGSTTTTAHKPSRSPPGMLNSGPETVSAGVEPRPRAQRRVAVVEPPKLRPQVVSKVDPMRRLSTASGNFRNSGSRPVLKQKAKFIRGGVSVNAGYARRKSSFYWGS